VVVTKSAAAANLESMKFLARLATGQIALWCTFWLIGIPLAILWDASGACMVTGCGIGEPLVAGSVIVLFALASVVIPFMSVAIWRSASNYSRALWWHTLIAWSAKLCAALSGLAAALSVLAILYFIVSYIYAAYTAG
jgi:hypothetical protein